MPIVKGSNVDAPGGNRANNGFLPLSREGSPVRGTDYGHGGDRRGGSADLAGHPSPLHVPNQQFQVGHSAMPQPPSAVKPGVGDIVEEAWRAAGNARGGQSAAIPRLRDTAKR